MKIAIDAGCLGVSDERLKVGVYVVVSNLLKELGKIDRKNLYYLYSFHPIEKNLLKSFGKNMHNIVIPSFGWLSISLPLRLLIDKPDLFIAPSQAMPLKLPSSHYKTIGIFHDIAFEKYPELYSYAANVEKHNKNSRDLAKNADALISVSESTKKDIEHIYGVSSRKILVAHPGINQLQNSPAFQNNKPYFLFVGAFKKSKNIPLFVRGFARFLKQTHKDFDLFLVGGDKWIDPEIQQTIDSLSGEVQQHIKIFPFVDSPTLASLYKGAFAFVSPSLYEGFGLSFLEAQSVGIPVVGSFRGSLPEILGKSALLVNPKSVNMLTVALSKIATDRKLYKSLSQKGRENVKKYSWKTFARLVQSAITSL